MRLHIDQSIQPTALRHRRIAFHLRPKVKEELCKLEDAAIIEKLEGPTPWVSPIVIARKQKQPGEVRICIDMRLPNAAIKQERHLTPTVDDILCDLSGADGSRRWTYEQATTSYPYTKIHAISKRFRPMLAFADIKDSTLGSQVPQKYFKMPSERYLAG